jgi:PAS domain S-box-containing protein
MNVNLALARHLGYESVSEIEGRNVLEFIPEEFHKDYQRVVQTKMFGKEVLWENVIVALLKKSGKKVVADVAFSRVSDDILMGILWHQRQQRSFLSKAISKHRQSEQLSNLLKN